MATNEPTMSGIVEAVNEKGVKIAGAWSNYSKFAVGIVAPSRGDTVTLTLDKAGFVRSVTVIDGIPPIAGGSDALARAATDKDRTITRLAVLKAAAEFGASRQNLKSGDVLKIAASWVRWVEDDATLGVVADALVDAF